MKYILIILLIIVVYYAYSWYNAKKKDPSGESGNPYGNKGNTNSKDTGPYASQSTGNNFQSSGTNYAKWIGGGLGWAFGGPIGGILGYMFGSMMGGGSGTSMPMGQTRTGDFNISLLILTASIMKADGKVTRSELDYVKQFLNKNFGTEKAVHYVKILGDLVKQDFNIQEVSFQIKQYMDYSSRLLLLQYMFGIALADGKSHENEVSMIETIAGFMGISANDYASIKAMFIKDTNSAYKILEVSPDASDDDIKKAYRELAKKYHPDKVSHLGEEVRKTAEEKITALNAAYEAIKEERGMK